MLPEAIGPFLDMELGHFRSPVVVLVMVVVVVAVAVVVIVVSTKINLEF